MLKHIEITSEQLQIAVATATSDDDVALWLHEHADLSNCEHFNQDKRNKGNTPCCKHGDRNLRRCT